MTDALRRRGTAARAVRGALVLLRDVIRHPGSGLKRIRTACELLRSGSVPAALTYVTTIRPRRPEESYAAWIARFEQPSTESAPAIPISLILNVAGASEAGLASAIDSVVRQTHPHWELRIPTNTETAPELRAAINVYSSTDSRITSIATGPSASLAVALNTSLAGSTGGWVITLDAGGLLAPAALSTIASCAAKNPEAALIYSDEDEIDSDERRCNPWFKPNYSRELLRSQNYFGRLVAYRIDELRQIGGWQAEHDGATGFDVNLRMIERIRPAQIVHIAQILHHTPSAGRVAAIPSSDLRRDTAVRALRAHLARSGIDAEVEHIAGSGNLRMHLPIPTPAPRVTVIIPTRDRADLLRTCVSSVLDKTTYPDFDILIVDNESRHAETTAYLDELQRSGRVGVLSHPGAFNFSAINNRAVHQATGEVVALVNNDVEVITPGWLTEMTSWALQPDIGCVGAMLYYPNDLVQHAGLVLGLGGVVGRPDVFAARHSPGFHGRLEAVRNVSAVTAACLVVRKSVYERVGGFDADNLPVAFNDVDFCLRVAELGLSNVWTPFAELYHRESRSRGSDITSGRSARLARDAAYLRSRWALDHDPYHSPHLASVADLS